jgi:pimeloyl-ACP methyl ester carboxylesterase
LISPRSFTVAFSEQALDRAMKDGTLLRSSGADDGPRVLVVFLPGLAIKQARYTKLLSLLVGEEFLRNCDLLRFAFDNGYASTESPAEVAWRLTAEIEAHHRERDYETILIIGQSLGALIARQAILDGHRGGHEWVTRRVRMALLADSNRGFIPRDITQKVGTWLLSIRLESIFGRPLPRWGDLASNILRGSPWVTGLRLGWIRHFAEEGAPEPPVTIQVRGLCDRVVADDDSEDVNRIDNSELITVPNVGHEDIVTVSGPDDHLYRLLRDNIARILREDGAGKEKLRAFARGGADLLIFLVHGIRDFAEWQNAIEFQVRRRSEGRTVTVVPVQYGFFTLLQFLLPSQRDRAVRVFIDRYVQEVIKSPNAKVVVAAHSNGTYVVGKALERCDFLKAERVYFAGSVLSGSFPWDRLIGTQVGAVRNDCAKWDVPVGLICSALGSLPVYRDLGTAGYRGFRGAGVQEGLTNNLSIDGVHGAALRPQNRDEVADYLLTGGRASPETLIGESPLMRGLSAVAPLFLWLVVGVLGLAFPIALSFGLTGWVAVYASMAYALLVLWLLMRL